MQLTARLLISIVIAALAWAALHFVPAIPVVAALFCATIATALFSSIPATRATRHNVGSPSSPQASPQIPAGAEREEGSVKWFNVSKGFGFITKDDGEEIFVHFRSIRGEGHRSLRDGQRVSFVEAQTDKGPQAEDVVAL